MLTPRQHQVSALIADGLTNKQIARSLGIGPSTVKQHVQAISDKLGVRGRVKIAVAARNRDMLALADDMERAGL